MERDKQAIAALAAGIVIARGVKGVRQIQEAWRDAEHIVAPDRTSGAYQQWLKEHEEKVVSPVPMDVINKGR